jgi:RNA polymerase subunit RPABC4/transcription elongation factor Spt4
MSAIARTPSHVGVAGVVTCPACGGPLKHDSDRCPACGFTGAHSMDLFPEAPPPLMPILDAAGIFDGSGVRKIEAARDRLRRRFPQFQWRVCTVVLPPGADLAVFGFWLLNVCPFHGKETAQDRAATVLLVIDGGTGRVAAVPGYAVEPVLSDENWKAILGAMAGPWRAGDPVEAVIRFFKNARIHLERAWKSYGARRSAR